MIRQQPIATEGGWREFPPEVCNGIYKRLLAQTHSVAEECLDRLSRLHDRFPAELPENLINALRAFHAQHHPPAVAPEVDDRRWAPRFPGMGEAVIISDPRRPELARKVATLDFCHRGMRVRSDARIDVGTVLAIRQPGTSDSPALAEVRYCIPSGMDWVIGCELLRTS
jgi:hypothetical protein